MNAELACITGYRFEDGDYVVQQYRVMSDRCSYRFKVVGCLKLPKIGYHGKLIGIGPRTRRHVRDGLTRKEAFELANALNRLNNLPLHEPKTKTASPMPAGTSASSASSADKIPTP